MVDEARTRAVREAVDPDEVLAHARALIAAPSENPGGDEEEVAEIAAEILRGMNASVRIVRSETGRPSVIGTIGSGERPKLAWNGHLDVVPAGSLEGWSNHPFKADVEDGRLIGRGATDMKGAVASALAAAAALVRTGVPLRGTLEFHLVADEEMAGAYGTKVLWEQGLLDQDAAIVGEPTQLKIALAERGGAWIVATSHGRAAHGSQPHLGVNAILGMSKFLLRLPETLPDAEHALVGRPTVNAALIQGGTAPNVVPDLCVVDIDRRTVPGEGRLDDVLDPFRALALDLAEEDPDARIDVEVREWILAAEAPSDSRIAGLAREAIEAETGATPDDVGFTGITDARFYINDAYLPTIILGPGSLSVAHTTNEWVEVDELVAAARIYAQIFASYLSPALT
jgi:succinyl-diaminopimelate desuccinylase